MALLSVLCLVLLCQIGKPDTSPHAVVCRVFTLYVVRSSFMYFKGRLSGDLPNDVSVFVSPDRVYVSVSHRPDRTDVVHPRERFKRENDYGLRKRSNIDAVG